MDAMDEQQDAPCVVVKKRKDEPNGDRDAPYNPVGVRNTDSSVALRRVGPVEHDYTTEGPAPGDLPFRWVYGSVCAAKNRDPRVHVMAYNEDTYVLRENPCVHWEAPFTYLLFGNSGALLIDTGATAEARYYPLRATVDALMVRWCTMRGRKSVPLTVVLTSGEDAAQNMGLGQFAGRAETRVTPVEFAARRKFMGVDDWPRGVGRIDLGGRVVEVIPAPGTHRDGVVLYDSYTRNLYTGDLLYPGRVQIANDRDYVASLTRLAEWKKTHRVKWVMGGHLEMMFAPGRAYPRFSTFRPFERVLQLDGDTVDEALEAAKSCAGRPEVAFREEFILLNRVSPDEKVYQNAPGMVEVPVPYWNSLSK